MRYLHYKKLLLIQILSVILGAYTTHGKVDPPNYNFSLDKLSLFGPGADFKEIQTQYKDLELISDGDTKVYKVMVAQLRYVFPLYMQVYQGKVIDFYARLPSYFLHDVFHQSLINRYGKQDLYRTVETNAIYIWKNAKNIRITYGSTCTITCFPIYLAEQMVTPPEDLLDYNPVFKKINKKSAF